MRDTGALAALPFEIALDRVKTVGDAFAANHASVPLSLELIALHVRVLNEILGFLPALFPRCLGLGHRLVRPSERLSDAPDGMTHPFQLLQRLLMLVFQMGQGVAAGAVHHLGDFAEFALHVFDCRIGFVTLLLLPLQLAAILRQLVAYRGRQPGEHPRAQGGQSGVILRIGDLQITRLPGRLIVFGVFVADFTQGVHLSGVFFHTAEVLGIPVVILNRLARLGQGVRDIEHTLLENIVKPRRRIRRLDFVQQPACCGFQSHACPHGFMEVFRVRIHRAPRIHLAQLVGGER